MEEAEIRCSDRGGNHSGRDVPPAINVLYTNGMINSWEAE